MGSITGKPTVRVTRRHVCYNKKVLPFGGFSHRLDTRLRLGLLTVNNSTIGVRGICQEWDRRWSFCFFIETHAIMAPYQPPVF